MPPEASVAVTAGAPLQPMREEKGSECGPRRYSSGSHGDGLVSDSAAAVADPAAATTASAPAVTVPSGMARTSVSSVNGSAAEVARSKHDACAHHGSAAEVARSKACAHHGVQCNCEQSTSAYTRRTVCQACMWRPVCYSWCTATSRSRAGGRGVGHTV
jgi:hypothetical protein